MNKEKDLLCNQTSCQCLKSCHQEGPWLEGAFAGSPPAGIHYLRSWGKAGIIRRIVIRPLFVRVIGLPLLTCAVCMKSTGGCSNLEKSFLGQGRRRPRGCPGALTAEPSSL